jgi:hypothetical protein
MEMEYVFGAERFDRAALEAYLADKLDSISEYVGFHHPTTAAIEMLMMLHPKRILCSMRAAIHFATQLQELRCPILVLEVGSDGTILSHETL